MKVLQIFVLAILVSGFSVTVKSQACCAFNLRLYVTDLNGKPLNNVKAKINSFDLDYNSQTGAYTGWDLIGVGTKYNDLLKVKVKGFEDFEKEIQVTCGFQNYELRLKAKGENETSVFEELAHLQGKVVDANGGVIQNTKVILTDEEGKKIQTFTNDYGYYNLIAKSGKYLLEFIGTNGFLPKKYQKFLLSKGLTNFNVTLDIKGCGDPTINCSPITTNPIKPK
jgi:hypothetical protein